VSKEAYRRLIDVARASLKQASNVKQMLRSQARLGGRLADELERFEGLLERVVEQTERRVLGGESVAAGEKLVSLFEEHTAIIARGKAGKRVEFGRKVWLDEVEGGIVSGYRVLEGNPADEKQLLASLENHLRVFERPPWLVAADRGVYSSANEEAARGMGVERVALPKKGAKNEKRRGYERQGWFRRARRFRAGIEGRISVMKRRGYLGRCRDKGEEGFLGWVGWGVLSSNLHAIARAEAAR
jgi:IS5 family transposase